MAAVFTENNPTVQMVRLNVDGTPTEFEFDSAPARNHLVEIMGGKVTIVGQYTHKFLILLKLVDPKDAELNTAKLHAPFDQNEVHGPIALVRMNDESEPMDFTLKDYETFMGQTAEEVAALEAEALAKIDAELEANPEPELEMEGDFEGIDDETRQEFEQMMAQAADGNDDEEDEDENATGIEAVVDFKDQLLSQVVGFYQEEHGRAPTQEEALEAMKKVLLAMQSGDIDAEEDEDYEEAAENVDEDTEQTEETQPEQEVTQPKKKKNSGRR